MMAGRAEPVKEKEFSRLPFWGALEEKDPEKRRKEIVGVLFSLLGIFALIPFGVFAYFQHNFLMGAWDHLTAVFLALNLILFQKHKNANWALYSASALVTPFYFFLFYTGGQKGTAALWYYTYPLLGFLIIGLRPGLLMCLLLFLPSFLLLLGFFQPSGFFQYPVDFTIRFIPSLLVVLVVAYLYEATRETTQGKVIVKNEELKKRIEELKALQERLLNNQIKLRQEIREREKAEADLLLAKETAEQANRSKTEFLANMSHELRTPLNHIIGFTELVADKRIGALNRQQEEYLQDVVQSSRHLLSLITDILDLSKVEAGKMNLEASEIPLEGLLRDSFNMVKEKALKHGIALTPGFQDLPESIRADERKLKQILYNLLSNAVKFTPDGGRVELEARGLDGQGVEITVSDTGIGLPEADLERIFKPFEQGDNSAGRNYQGTGLGLSLARKLVELHGGRIWAESEGPGRGSRFHVLLPLQEKQGAEG